MYRDMSLTPGQSGEQVFRPTIYPWQMNWAETFPSPNSASMRSKVWISLERVRHVVHMFIAAGVSEGFFSISNSKNCLICWIGSISCSTSSTNLNQWKQQRNRFSKDKPFSKDISKFSLTQLSFAKGVHCNNQSMSKFVSRSPAMDCSLLAFCSSLPNVFLVFAP